MTEPEMKRALGVLIGAMAEAAFEGTTLDGPDCHALLQKAGLIFVRPATAEDIANSEYGEFMEPGDDRHELMPFAIENWDVCRPSSCLRSQSLPIKRLALMQHLRSKLRK